jgi:2'-hydroxyisoflavone reductase
MRILVVGGTRFVGRHVVEAALAAEHDVTLLHRGRGDDDLFPEAEHLHADRDVDLSLLARREFDATVDTSAYFPRQVRSLSVALDGRGGRYLVISSTSVYAQPDAQGFDESSHLVEPAGDDVTEITEESYGRLKVSVEIAARELHHERATVVRPTYVIGPWDYTQRFTYWVERLAEGGEVLAPGNPDDPIQVIDGRDMGVWIVGLLEDDVTGTFHAVSPAPPYTFGLMLGDVAAAVAPEGTTLTWVDQQWLLDQGETGESLPLWGAGDPWIDANTADPSAARATGLAPRSLRDSAAQTLEHVRVNPWPSRAPGALTREREAELLASWHAR